ncbi:MAG: VOC family protein [Aphanocapsa feldmannii 277cV]|uniref:VOC family protein n=2 Tax=Aphanocapsa feldmannii TaxID=192050 RepID=A0A524RM50_9CHRO|nr:MAG: VOC family protein [Aphanocapsa feldmannii 288cV]TGG91252.1 MAG: VOC family protein [Aphanocapsa feldmannii 277cV]TGH20619.1 MAG: VOC family protein [Aphanocapsa feldmannii 277cI]
MVSDLQCSLVLYKDLLGFRLDWISDRAGPHSYLYTTFGLPPEARLIFASLSSPTEPRALALTEVTGVTMPAAGNSLALVIGVPSVEAIQSGLSRLGLASCPINRFTTESGGRYCEQACRDPDGHLLVLYSDR